MFKILSGSEPVPAGAIPVRSDAVTVMLTFGFVFSMLFQKQVCSQPCRPACHRGVIVRFVQKPTEKNIFLIFRRLL